MSELRESTTEARLKDALQRIVWAWTAGWSDNSEAGSFTLALDNAIRLLAELETVNGAWSHTVVEREAS